MSEPACESLRISWPSSLCAGEIPEYLQAGRQCFLLSWLFLPVLPGPGPGAWESMPPAGWMPVG